MNKSAIQPSTEYAFREKRTPGTPFQRVVVIEHIRKNKWKVKWVDPNPGLVDYVESGQLIVPWKEVKAFTKEEENAGRLREHNEHLGYDHEDSPVVRALDEVFDSCGDEVDFYKGSVVGMPEAIMRLWARAGLEVGPEFPAAYVDRQGKLHLPLDVAMDFARKFSATEPATVLVGDEAAEREWAQDAQRGEDHIVGLLNKYRASWALIRQWASYDAAVAEREATIQRLERYVWDAIYALQKARSMLKPPGRDVLFRGSDLLRRQSKVNEGGPSHARDT